MTDKLRVNVFLMNTGYIREELSRWRVKWAGDARYDVTIVGARHRPIASNRNLVTKRFLDGDADFMMMIDDDVVPAQNPLDLLQMDLDIVVCPTPMFAQGRTGDFPIHMNVELMEHPDGLQDTYVLTQPDPLMEISTGGTGCIIIARRVLELKRDAPQFKFVGLIERDRRVDPGAKIARGRTTQPGQIELGCVATGKKPSQPSLIVKKLDTILLCDDFGVRFLPDTDTAHVIKMTVCQDNVLDRRGANARQREFVERRQLGQRRIDHDVAFGRRDQERVAHPFGLIDRRVNADRVLQVLTQVKQRDRSEGWRSVASFFRATPIARQPDRDQYSRGQCQG